MASTGARVIYFGNSRTVFSNRHFEALTHTSADVVAFVDSPAASISTDRRAGLDSYIRDTVAGRGIPYSQPDDVNDPEFVAHCGRLQPDLFVAVGYTLKLGGPLLSVPKVGAVNFHASLLPAYRGLHPVFWALYNGEIVSGVTVHHLDAGLDTGPIAFQVRVNVRRRHSVAALYDRIILRSLPLVRRVVRAARHGGLPSRPQDDLCASYFSKVRDEHYRVDWRQPARIIEARVYSAPGKFYFEWSGQRIYPIDAAARNKFYSLEPGAVVRTDRFGAIVAAGSGSVRMSRVLIDGESRPVTTMQLRRGTGFGAPQVPPGQRETL